GVSRITVRRAVQNLVRRGLVEIQRGRGTFVASRKITQELTQLSGFVGDMQAIGRKATARLLDRRFVNASETVARQLALPKGSRVLMIQRVRLGDGVPISFDETYLPLDLGKKVMRQNLAIEPIFSLLECKYKVPLVEAEYKMEAVAAEAEVASALRVNPGSPMFLIERTSYSTGARPVDYEKLYYRGDVIRFVTRLARKPRS
ncbi:MAG: GntR family transcriptional regulator, partial [Bryobacteraceae bacterium]